jgi:short-subunit dehydrogenase
MRLKDRRVLLTGASGGIGRELAFELARNGASLLLSGRRAQVLDEVASSIVASGGNASILPSDLTKPGAAQALIDRASAGGEPIDAVISCAGVSYFGLFEEQPPEELQCLWQTNVLAPMHLVQAALPVLKAQKSGLIVNVGSIFGSIGFPCFAAYSASKFALRGFSEALRRELLGSGIDVLYVAPRYTRTAINEGAVSRMAEAVAMKQDQPQAVARTIVAAMLANKRERFFGWPERFFVRLNGLFPRLVDKGLRTQGERMRAFAPSPQLSKPEDRSHAA